ncbi:MAG: hypothetical protein JO243_03050 [Solirubrobacterales bacterium]|nr:hypothetical protein [Solirubrobacterales bacterium]
MALPFIPSDAGLLALQAAVVAAPRPMPRAARLSRIHGRGWALVPIGSIVVVVFAIRYVSDTATGLTWLALIAVPLLAAAALGWAARGSRPWAALLAIPLFLLAWLDKTSLVGEASGALLSALSCVTLGVLLAAVTPPAWLKAGIVLMAAADTWLVVSDLLQAPNAALVAAHPPAGLPQLQGEIFGTVTMGYGDLFVAGLLGAVLAAQWRRQWRAALLTFAIAALFDLLFLVIAELPATVPVALALLITEGWETVSGSRRAPASLQVSGTPLRARPRNPRLRIRRSPRSVR